MRYYAVHYNVQHKILQHIEIKLKTLQCFGSEGFLFCNMCCTSVEKVPGISTNITGTGGKCFTRDLSKEHDFVLTISAKITTYQTFDLLLDNTMKD